MKFLAMHITNQKISFDIFIFIYFIILIIFAIKKNG